MNRINTLKRSFSTSNKVIFEYHRNNVKVTLNNEKALNAVDFDMLTALKDEINKWTTTKKYPDVMILTTNPESKAFSAGGDVKHLLSLKTSMKDNYEELEKYFKLEYEVDYLLSKLKDKQVITVALWNGIVMGGGAGISLNSLFKVACEKTIFAMPEARIGLFTDIGAVYHLTKLPEGLRNAMGLACMRLKGEEVYLSGLASDFVNKDDFGKLTAEIFSISEEDFNLRKQEVGSIIHDLSSKIGTNAIEAFRNKVNKLESACTGRSVEEIYKKLSEDKEPLSQELSKNMAMNSPLSMKVILKHFEFAKQLDLRTNYLLDFQIIQHYMRMDEFFIGVKNLLVDKSKEAPNWTYEKLEDVDDKFVEKIFHEKPKDATSELDRKIFKL